MPFADRLAALVEERRSQVCLGIDPDPATLPPHEGGRDRDSAAEVAARAATDQARELIARAGPACVAVKLQLACFERFGAPGWRALELVAAAAREAGLLVVADGKRGDVPVTARAYAEALFGITETPYGPVVGLDADAATVNPLLGGDALEPMIAGAERAGAGLFCLVRTSNPGAADVLDLPAGRGPLHEQLAHLVAERAPRLGGADGLSGLGAVVGATEPRHLARLRELMPSSIFLVPGVGAQGGAVSEIRPAFSEHPASVLMAVSRAIAHSDDPARAAEALRDELWALSQRPAR